MEALKELMGSLSDPVSVLPELDTLFADLVPVIRFAVLLGPGVVLALGLVYLFLAPKEANHSLGFRCWWGMGSVEVWRFTQKTAGITWTALGLVLGSMGLFTTIGYAELTPDVMLFDALRAIMWQVVLVAISIVAINLVLIVLYDSKGRRRGRRKSSL